MVNIRDIAQMADVSLSTVSRVINKNKYVSEKTRNHVQSIIDETGYIKNGVAVKLSTGKSGVIGVQIPYNNTCYDQLIDSILLTAKEKCYQVQLLPTYYEQETENYYYAMLEQKVIDGLILTSRSDCTTDLDQMLLRGRVISTEKLENVGVPMIYADREQAYEKVFAHLFEQKAQDVVFIAKRSSEQSITTRNKIKAYEKYFGKAKENKNFFIGIDQYESGYSWALNQVKEQRIPAYIYVNGDNTAAGILQAFQENGWEHNKDFTLIGEGNLSYSRIFNFSTIDFASEEIGKECVEFLLSDKKTIKCGKEPTFILRK
ncbi:LacI family DNA-binding transcriptional regulator [Candidatus Enterococcus murrayae]|uniref:LacI family DNA-binding transcriptional regulator n=1 Tax=Candidatus Enterococcus murrayae TaxID=2815321 RepID=A0ABS3HLG2_9ENTE|nr:LacI family DNA-binding transcriptional regulator [Enterococcus sp. MJM16]